MNLDPGLKIEIIYEFRADPGPSISLDELIEVMKMKNMQIIEVNREENYLILGRGKDLVGLLGRPT